MWGVDGAGGPCGCPHSPPRAHRTPTCVPPAAQVRLLYKGTLRVLLLLLHDFPEFLCEFHFHLCDVIPPSCIQVRRWVVVVGGGGLRCGCVWLPCGCTLPPPTHLFTVPPHTHSAPIRRPQMRNLVLSAFPRAMRLPDPFTPNLKVDLLPEIAAPPRYVPAPEQLLPPPLRAEVDAYLAARSPPAFLLGLRARLTLPPAEALACGTKYNAPLINALAFYLGCRAVEAAPPEPGTSPSMATPHAQLLQQLLRDLDTGEGGAGRGKRPRGADVLHVCSAEAAANPICVIARPSQPHAPPPPLLLLSLHYCRGAVPADQRAGQPPALPQRAHPLLLLRPALPLHRGRQRAGARADHARAAGAPHCQQASGR